MGLPPLAHGALHDFAPGAGAAAAAFAADYDDGDWLPVPIPGDVHRALVAGGRLPEPFYDRNELACAWVEEREWWYRIRFDDPAQPLAADERLRLVCHGLDTFATLWLNGVELGRHENMFREAVFDIGDRVRVGGPNLLAIRFDPPLTRVAGVETTHWKGHAEPRVAMRKAQYGYGWDWGPRLPTVGVWRPIELRRERCAALAGVHAFTADLAPDHSAALLAVRVEAALFAADAPLAADLRLLDPDGRELERRELALAGTGTQPQATASFVVGQPRLWWTHELGEPARYTLDVRLLHGGVELARRVERVGIRTIALDQSPDPEEPGTRFFRFVLNGVPIFAKGANWIPAESFIGAIEPERYDRLLRAARDGNMTMLRVWGGGVYEHDRFYELCDELGMLVWQDFMFACAPYPETAGLLAEVEAEAVYQVRRLRNHPSLALWCGNNENQWLHDVRHWDTPGAYLPGTQFYDRILPAAVADHDGRTPYWPGSPYGGDDHNSMREGDRHNWDVWHGNRPFTRQFGEKPSRDFSVDGVSYLHYADDMGRFISEFGMHAAPVLATLQRVVPAEQLYHHSPAMDHHNKDNPKNKGDNLMQGVTGLPRDLHEYIVFSMIAQAEGLKFGIEHYRRRTPHCSGALFWQLNDCWPVQSWSVLDYYGVGKAGYYYARRAFAPVLASFKACPDGTIELWVTNDTRALVADRLLISVVGFGGDLVWERAVGAEIQPGGSRAVARLSPRELRAGPDRVLVVRSAAGRIAPNRQFFAPIKELPRPAPQLKVAVSAAGPSQLHVDLFAEQFTSFVQLAAPDPATHYSDNYLDLLPGEQQRVVVTSPAAPLTPDMLVVSAR